MIELKSGIQSYIIKKAALFAFSLLVPEAGWIAAARTTWDVYSACEPLIKVGFDSYMYQLGLGSSNPSDSKIREAFLNSAANIALQITGFDNNTFRGDVRTVFAAAGIKTFGAVLYRETNSFTFSTFQDAVSGSDGVSIVGGDKRDFAIGSMFSDQFSGLSGSDKLMGMDGADTLNGGPGDDTLDGGDGTDTAIFAGSRASYTIIVTGVGEFTISSAAEGADTLTGIELAQFADQTVTLSGSTDTIAPSVLSFSPVDEESGVAIGSNIVLSFSEPIARGTGSLVLKTAAGATIETFDAATSNRLALSGSTLTIDPTSDLANGTNYYLTFAAGTVKDLAGNAYAGITTYDFTTASSTSPLSKLDDFMVLQYASPSVVGAGVGNDTYLLSNAMLPAGTKLTITDPQGSNSIQLASGLAIASSKLNSNTLQLTLSNGSEINVLGADRFTYEAGGNATADINLPDVGYATFVQTTLGVAPPTGSTIASGGAVTIGSGLTGVSPTASSKLDDFVVLQYASPSVVGAGGGSDTYLLSNAMLPAGTKLTITDPQGGNSIQLASGLAIASSKLNSNTLQLTLSNGSEINVLGADRFTYEAGGNATAGINLPDVDYATFVQTTLGVALPTGSTIASGGAVTIGSRFTNVPLVVGSTAPVTASAASEAFTFNVAGAKASAPNTQIQINGFSTANDQLTIDTVTAAGHIKLAALNGIDGITVLSNLITGDTLIDFGADANGDVITITLAGMTDPSLVNVSVV